MLLDLGGGSVMITCGHCGKEFYSSYPQTKWCSLECRNKAANKRRKIKYRTDPEIRRRHIEHSKAFHAQRIKADKMYRRYRKLVGQLSNYRTSLEFHKEKVEEFSNKVINKHKEVETFKAYWKSQR